MRISNRSLLGFVVMTALVGACGQSRARKAALAEAVTTVRAIAAGAKAGFENETMEGTLAPGEVVKYVHKLCASGDWTCLHVEKPTSTACLYTYDTNGAASFTARAVCNPDNDGKPVIVEIVGTPSMSNQVTLRETISGDK